MRNSWKSSTRATSKYHAIKTTVDSITFDSKKEAKRYLDLKMLSRTGAITNLRLQEPYVLIERSKYGRPIKYIADFVYYDNSLKKEVVEDTKGFRTDVYKLKKRLMAEKYGIEVKEI